MEGAGERTKIIKSNMYINTKVAIKAVTDRTADKTGLFLARKYAETVIAKGGPIKRE